MQNDNAKIKKIFKERKISFRTDVRNLFFEFFYLNRFLRVAQKDNFLDVGSLWILICHFDFVIWCLIFGMYTCAMTNKQVHNKVLSGFTVEVVRRRWRCWRFCFHPCWCWWISLWMRSSTCACVRRRLNWRGQNMKTCCPKKSCRIWMIMAKGETNPAIEWATIVEPFHEPYKDRMWIRAVCSASFIDSKGQQQDVELEH